MYRTIGLICGNYAPDIGELTASRPLIALPVDGRYRLMDFSMSNLVNSGIKTVGIIAPQNYRSVLDHLGTGKGWFLNKKNGGIFILPGHDYGLKHLDNKFLLKDLAINREFLDKSDGDQVIISSGNQIFNIDYTPIMVDHRKKNADITLIYKQGQTVENGLYLDESHDRLQLSSSGEKLFVDCYIMKRSVLLKVLELYKGKEYTGFDTSLNAYEFKGYLGRIESVKDYFDCNMDCLNSKIQWELFMMHNRIHTKIKDNPPSWYLTHAHVQNCFIASGSTIDGDVSDSILFRGVQVKAGAEIKGSILLQGVEVGENAVLEHVIVDKYAVISPDVVMKGTEENPIILGKKAVI
ncbi:MAG: glucose-1-phosphate adenylyltransferase subunit GlgD [Anaerovorax sp.]